MSNIAKKLKYYIQSRKTVRLSRSKAGDIGVFIFLLLICAFMILRLTLKNGTVLGKGDS